MSALVFSAQRLRELRERAGQISAVLVLLSESISGPTRPDRVFERRVRRFYREVPTTQRLPVRRGRASAREVLDYLSVQERALTAPQPVLVKDVGPNHELRPARLTVLLVELADVYAAETIGRVRALDLAAARACGFKTLQGLQTDWQARHPAAQCARLVWFTLGDVRDRSRYLQRHVSAGGDYTYDWTHAIDELPALSEQELQELSLAAQHRDTRRQAEVAQAMGQDLTLAQRVAWLEAQGARVRRDIKNELDIIETRTQRGLRKLS